MKKILLMVIAVVAANVVSAQTYYDAKTLFRILKNPGTDSLFQFEYPSGLTCRANPGQAVCEDYQVLMGILRSYAPADVADLDDREVIDHYRLKNPYFKYLRSPGSEVSAGTESGLARLASSAIGTIGGLDVTSFADGLAKFLVERTKEELNVAFFEKLKGLLEHYPEFKVVFPNTHVFLNSFESWQYASLINTLREAFDKDLKQLLANLIELRNLKESDCPEKSKSCRERMKELEKFFSHEAGIVMLSSLQLGNALQGGQRWPDALSTIAGEEFMGGYPNDNVKASVQLLDILSKSIKSEDLQRHYITAQEFAQFRQEKYFTKIFLGLIYEQVRGIRIGNVTLTNVFDRANGLMNYMAIVQQSGQKLQDAIERLATKRVEGKDVPADYVAVFDAANLWLRTVSNVRIIDPSLTTPPQIGKMFELTAIVSQIAHDIVVKNYNAAVVGVLKLVNDQVKKDTTTNYVYIDEFKSSFLSYGSFGANIVNAKTPEEVKQAIRTIAQPAGSSSVKKTSDVNIALSAYVGFVNGKDVPGKGSFTITDQNGVKTEVKLNGGRAWAVYAPVGVSFSKGMLFSKKSPWSATLFLSVIDVGALVGYRFTDDSTTTIEPKVKLANIFAPGANFAIGLPRVPISVGYGIQYIPSMQRNPGDNQLYNVDYSGWRKGQWFVAVDIPLVNFHTGKKYMLSRTRKK